MDSEEKLAILGRSAQYDLCGSHCQPPRIRKDAWRWIYPAVLPDGRQVRLLKVLMTNECRNNCLYCVNRSSRDFRRSEFEPAELARLFYRMWRAGLVRGLFLSSAVKGDPDRTMARMIAAAELVRGKYGFTGYVHLKVLPGASYAAAERAAQLADRISVNLEAPTARHLGGIAPEKRFDEDILQRIRWLNHLVRRSDTRARSHTTQFVVGAAGESDRDILERVDELYGRCGLGRAYYSAYQPPDEEVRSRLPSVPLLREHRLYQADWLMRKYGFGKSEIPYEDDGNLPLSEDPKSAWAVRHPERFPVEVNRAPLESLLRVPGIGPVSARRICTERRRSRLRRLSDLRRLGVVVSRALPYILVSGRRYRGQHQQQLAWPNTCLTTSGQNG